MSTNASRAGGIAIPAVAAAALYSRPASKGNGERPGWPNLRPSEPATAGSGKPGEISSPASDKRDPNRG